MTQTVTAAARHQAANQEMTMLASREMPQYQSHKKVWALKIKAVELRPANGHIIHPEDAVYYAPFEVSDDYVQKHNPQAGGYYVVYEDGYKSYSPAAAFESGYTAIEARNKGADQSTEAAIVAAGANVAPRITPVDIEANIACEYFFTADKALQQCPIHQSLGLLTFCVLVLKNGFTVTGESACASPENFNEAIGRRIARENAIAKVWPLMGYALRSKLAGA
jgi:hypothetical protein